jgi:hypothetical protein
LDSYRAKTRPEEINNILKTHLPPEKIKGRHRASNNANLKRAATLTH